MCLASRIGEGLERVCVDLDTRTQDSSSGMPRGWQHQEPEYVSDQ